MHKKTISTKKGAGKNFSTFFTIALLFLMTVAIIPSVMGASAVDLGSACNFAILSKSGISTTGTTQILGNIGVSPIAATAITGFGLILDSSNQFSTSSLVNGKVYAANYASPTPSMMTTAVSNMQTAYTKANGQAAGVTELGAGNIGGKTLAPGVYKWSTGVTIPTDVTLSGNSNDIWIFQVAQTLTISSGKKVILSGGAQAKNVYWVVAGQTTLGTNSVFNGNILDKTAIVVNTGATLNGRALAQTAVTLQSNTVNSPTTCSSPPAPAVRPVAKFIGTPTQGHLVLHIFPLSVNFLDQSSNTPTLWKWEFQKSGTTIWTTFSTSQNPSYSFSAGTYTIRLTATNAGGSNTQTRQNYITVTR
jgi:PKD repeat protein